MFTVGLFIAYSDIRLFAREASLSAIGVPAAGLDVTRNRPSAITG